MTMLVEAKTSSNKYTLPTNDQRALKEYAHSVRANLTTLPSLCLVLIVAPSVTGAVELRLNRLEAEAGVPVRLMLASDLAGLRESLPGPLRLPSFRAAVLTSAHRVLDSMGNRLASEVTAIEQAHAALVRASLPGTRDTQPPLVEWGHPGGQTVAKEAARDPT